MTDGPTLIVEGLGRIERAEIRVRPLTLFLGENNTGKSYLATLLWGLMTPGVRARIAERGASLESFRTCDEWLSNKLVALRQQPQQALGEADFEILMPWLNEVLDQEKNAIVGDIFNDDRLHLRHLSFQAPWQSAVLRLSQADVSDIILRLHVGRSSVAMLSDFKEPAARAGMISLIAHTVATGVNYAVSPVFLPASRTGFMLLYKEKTGDIVEQYLQKTKRDSEVRPDLTRPAIMFLAMLNRGFGDKKGRFRDEAELLERGLGGAVVSTLGPATNEYSYRYHDDAAPLTMALSSSLVTELAPIILVLRHEVDLQKLFVEEPEAHLHPAMQLLLAQVFTQLVRKGLYLCLTTHSENFCQQVNNFIKIGAAPDRATLQTQFHYSDQDYLLPEEVAGYQFAVEGERTVVTEVAKSDQGLVMPTFNETLLQLNRQTLELQRATLPMNEHDR